MKLTHSITATLFLMAILFIPTISATSFGYNYLDQGDNVLEGANYSINVNNTEFHRGLTPQQVANLFDASAYYLKSNTFGFYNSTTLPAQTDYNSTGLIKNWSIGFNTTQFEDTEIKTIKTTWLTSFIEGLSKWLDYFKRGENIQLQQKNLTNVSYIQLNNIGGVCDLSVNGTICKNATGTYIIG
jgi:hypothetical protein